MPGVAPLPGVARLAVTGDGLQMARSHLHVVGHGGMCSKDLEPAGQPKRATSAGVRSRNERASGPGRMRMFCLIAADECSLLCHHACVRVTHDSDANAAYI